ncbi:MAG: RNHCP domain-containing protein [Candidatus Dojkabacteria bacterium]|nr:RNHCP domain-containing protein [Candidatus Dojkabacteria bacterium]
MIKRNDPFICENCRKLVPAAKNGKCRNHCNFCLTSKHVDITPGDRKHTCQGLMPPKGIEKRKKGYYILHVCEKCGIRKWNKVQEDDRIDSFLT